MAATTLPALKQLTLRLLRTIEAVKPIDWQSDEAAANPTAYL
ncbi:unnamed protein product, partial [Anisakis simplex]|uniref:Rop family plasmid primer RNA-binding protein n=1 Tax=Anisakis simplex TaxID=6269 RepID=A0A0M3JN50_ANISI